MKMLFNFVCGFLIIFYFDGYSSNKNKNQVLIDFDKPLMEVERLRNSDIELISTKYARWIIPKRIHKFVNLIQSNNSLLIKIDNSNFTNANENLYVCNEHQASKSVLEIYDIPTCCPCCSWYNQNVCKLLYDKVANCTTITLYAKTAFTDHMRYMIAYENDVIQIPCQMRSSHFNYHLQISNIFDDTQIYLNYSNGTLEYKDSSYSYDPTSGLCLNTSKLEPVNSYILCKYLDGEVVYTIAKLDLSTTIIHNSWAFINVNESVLSFNQTAINILHKGLIRIRCQSKYSYHQNQKLLLCMSLEIVSNTSRNFNCTEFEGFLSNELTVDSERIQNGSKLRCSTISPSRELSEEIETTIYKHNDEILFIKHLEFLNNKVFKVFSNSVTIDVPISYYSIPSNSHINCMYIENDKWKLNIQCNITIAEQCICRIEAREIIKKKLTANVSISIFNKKIKKTLSIILTYVYLNKSKLIGLTEKLEDYKNVTCEVEVSKPFNITWIIEYDKYKKYVYNSTSRNMKIPLNNYSYICIKCITSNEAGTSDSDFVCRQILDVEIGFKHTLQIFLMNSSILGGKGERISEIKFLRSKNNTIGILDFNQTFIKCVSRIKEDTLKLLVNQSEISSKNIKNVSTRYTQQILYELDIKALAAQNVSVKIVCQQSNHSDSSYFIDVLKTSIPKFIPIGTNVHEFFVGQNIHFTISLFSLPPAELTIISEKSNSYHNSKVKNQEFKIYQKKVNVMISMITITLFNTSQGDSGKYLIVASNIRGVSNYTFFLKQSTTSLTLKVCIIIGSLIMIIMVCLVFVLCYFKKSGYTIPIIQIPNSIYKSLEENYSRLPYIIWPDDLERSKWTIQSSSSIKVKEKIGGGNYGTVYTGVFKNSDSSTIEYVALKYPILSQPKKDDRPQAQAQFCQISLDCFINEIRILSLLTNCPNIIKMYGCTILKDWSNEKDGIKSPAMLVLEFCSNFSLSEFLTKNVSNFEPYTKYRKFVFPNEYAKMKIDDSITLLDLKRISLGIATGLEYLSALNIIHRDLASRNILIDEGKIPKICDFGLAIELDNDYSVSKSYQILTYNKALPYKILAPEALESKIFYLESDIWSFSLLLWDIFNLDKNALFPNINTPSELLLHISSKLMNKDPQNILPIPRYADKAIWKLIKLCWRLDPFDRPCANTIRNILDEIILSSPVETIEMRDDYQRQESIINHKCSSDNNNLSLMNYYNDSGHSNLVNESLL